MKTKRKNMKKVIALLCVMMLLCAIGCRTEKSNAPTSDPELQNETANNKSDSKTDVSEESILNTLYDIENWYIGEVWNNFVDFDWYISDGTDCTGAEIDIDFAYDKFLKEWEKKSSYDKYISSLSDEYADLKNIWPKMSEQMDNVYSQLESRV